MDKRNLTESNKQWLNSAIQLDFSITIYEEYATRIADLIFGEIKVKGGLYQNKYRKVFIIIVANLRVSYELMRPLHYSRHKDHYPKNGLGYTIIMKLIDTLVEIRFIEHCKGQYGDKRKSRIWVENKVNTLFDLFKSIHPDSVVKEPPVPIVKLRARRVMKNGKTIIPAHDIPYRRTHATNKMIKQLNQYNELLNDTKIEFHTDWANLDDIQKEKLVILIAEKRYTKLSILYPNSLYSIDSKTNINTIPIYNIKYTATDTVNYNAGSFSKNIVTSPLYYYGIDESKVAPYPPQKEILGIGISLKYKALHRCFTDDFNQGGRFYGAAWIDISRIVRKDLFINDEPVCEPDFSTYHLRMLYHELNIDYKDDAYNFIDDDHRGLLKAVAMAAINVKNRRSIIPAVKSLFGWKKKEGRWQVDYRNKHIMKHGDGILNKDFINDLVVKFLSAHSKIYSLLFKDSGLRLQNIDGIITYNILNYFIEKGIAILPVHDSFIVQQRYKDELIEVMKEKYKDHLGYDPVVT